MRKKILSFILLGTLIFGVMPFNLVSASETLPEPVLSVNFDDETLNGGTVGIEEYGVEYGDGVNGKALYLSNRTNGNHLYGKAAQNFAEFSLPEGTLTTGNYTVSIWYRSTLSEFVEGTLLSNLIDANSGLNLYTSGAQQLQAKIGDSAVTPLLNWQTTPMTGVIADREWRNVAVSVDRNAKKSVIYIDGKVYAERNINIEPSAEIGKDILTVGARGYDKKNGLDSAYVDELRVYNSALSADELSEVYYDAALPLLVERYSQAVNNIKIDGYFYTDSSINSLKQNIEAVRSLISNASVAPEEKKSAFDEFEELYNSVMYADNGADFSFAATSDTHLEDVSYTTRFENLLKDIKIAQPNSKALIVAGDLTNNGNQSEFNKYFTAVKNYAAGIPVISVMGNHDVRGPANSGYPNLGENFKTTALEYYLNGIIGSAGLESGYDKPYFHKMINGYHFFALNTETGLKDNSYISDTQLSWLYAELEKIKADDADGIIDRPIFVTLHQPLPDTFAGTDIPITDEAASATITNEMIDTAMNNLKMLLSDYPVIFFSGHRHDAVSEDSFIMYGNNIYVNMPAATVNKGTGENYNDSTMLLYYISIHGRMVRFRVRNFSTGMWLPEYETVYTMTSLDPEPEELPELPDEKPLDKIWLNTLYAFEKEETFAVTDEKGSPLASAEQNIVDSLKILDAAGALEVKCVARNWKYDYLHLPLDLKRNDTNGLLIYVKWNNNTNMAVTITGKTSDGTVKSVVPSNWSSGYPMYDTSGNIWKGSVSCDTNPTIGVGPMFEGYVYISWDKINLPNDFTEITDLAIGGFAERGSFTIGGLWAVGNELIPDSFSNNQITDEVWINNGATTLEKRAEITDKIQLSVIADFSDIEGITAHNDKNDASTTVLKSLKNRGAVGGGMALEIDAGRNGYWQNTYVNIPLSINPGSASGILVNAETWSNTNLRVKIFGKDSEGKEISGGMSAYSRVPIYDTYNDLWLESNESGGDKNTVSLPRYYFEGYVYIPFSRLGADFSEITGIDIGSYRSGTSEYKLTVGGIYLVENSVIPDYYSEGIITDVIVNGEECVISNTSLGDFNGDGNVDAIDFAAFKKHLLGFDTENTVDIKKDGVYNLIDLIKLKKILAS